MDPLETRRSLVIRSPGVRRSSNARHALQLAPDEPVHAPHDAPHEAPHDAPHDVTHATEAAPATSSRPILTIVPRSVVPRAARTLRGRGDRGETPR